MKINTSADLYIGKKAGTQLIKDIKNAKTSIMIISPYVSNKQLLTLKKKHSSGLNIEIWSSQESSNYNNYFKSMFCKTQRDITYLLAPLVLTAILTGFVYFNTKDLIINSSVLISGLLLSIFIYSIKKKYALTFPLKIYNSQAMGYLLHIKLYIIDDSIAYLGSLNFTNRGFFVNHESCFRITDPKAVSSIKNEFTKTTKRLNAMDVNQVL